MIINTLMALEKIQQVIKHPDGQLLIWGAGMQGKRLKRELDQMNYTISAFIDSSPSSRNAQSLSIPVYQPSYLSTLERGTFFVICSISNDEEYGHIRRKMVAMGLRELDDFGDFGIHHDRRTYNWLKSPFTEVIPRYPHKDKKADMEQYLSFQKAERRRNCLPKEDTDGLLALPYLHVRPTTFCNLHCQDCCNSIPYCNHVHYDAHIILEDLDKLLETTYIYQIHIMGGEVFIYPQLEKLLDGFNKLTNKERIGKLTVFTNGAAFPTDNALALLRNFGNSELQLSDYGDLSIAKDVLSKKSAEMGLAYLAKPQIDMWIDQGDHRHSHNYSEDELTQIYHVCRAAPHCITMQNSRLYLCARIAAQQESGLIPWDNKAFLDIRKIPRGQMPSALEKLLYETKKLDGCQFCNGDYIGLVQFPMARQMPAKRKI